MKLKVLADNSTIMKPCILAEHGLSFLIEDNGVKILFDAGYSDVFIKNAREMEADLLDLDYVVISHAHLDHARGLKFLMQLYDDNEHKKPKLIFHSMAMIPKNFAEEDIDLSIDNLGRYFDFTIADNPLKLSANITYLGEVPRSNNFEPEDKEGSDSALVFKGQGGITVITACSHAGIVNICDYAKAVLKTERIENIIGGIYLFNHTDSQIQQTALYLKEQKLVKFYPCHCVDLKAKIALAGDTPVAEVGSGAVFEFK